jgi:hypothetical protein
MTAGDRVEEEWGGSHDCWVDGGRYAAVTTNPKTGDCCMSTRTSASTVAAARLSYAGLQRGTCGCYGVCYQCCCCCRCPDRDRVCLNHALDWQTHLDELGEVMSTNRFWSTLKGLRRKMSLPLLVTGAHWSGYTKE